MVRHDSLAFIPSVLVRVLSFLCLLLLRHQARTAFLIPFGRCTVNPWHRYSAILISDPRAYISVIIAILLLASCPTSLL